MTTQLKYTTTFGTSSRFAKFQIIYEAIANSYSANLQRSSRCYVMMLWFALIDFVISENILNFIFRRYGLI